MKSKLLKKLVMAALIVALSVIGIPGIKNGMLVSLQVEAAVVGEVVVETTYAYDCQRSPAYPTEIGGTSELWGFADPMTGDETSNGPWAMEYVGKYSEVSSEIQSEVDSELSWMVSRYDMDETDNVEIYSLKQYGAHVTYAFLVAEYDTGWLVVDKDGWGYYLTDSELTSSDRVTATLSGTIATPTITTNVTSGATDVTGNFQPADSIISIKTEFDDMDFIYIEADKEWQVEEKDFHVTNESQYTDNIPGYSSYVLTTTYTPNTTFGTFATGVISVNTGDGTYVESANGNTYSATTSEFGEGTTLDFRLQLINVDTDDTSVTTKANTLKENGKTTVGRLTVSFAKPE